MDPPNLNLALQICKMRKLRLYYHGDDSRYFFVGQVTRGNVDED